jgi:hypothetical protein
MHDRATPPMEQAQRRAAVAMETSCVGCDAALSASRCPQCGVAQAPGGYVVERVLAEGPHSRVYLARDATGHGVALKELQFSTVPSIQELDAFEREAEALRSLHHPAIPAFVGSFREGTGVGLRLYLASEHISGETLASRIARGSLGAEEARAIARQLLDVLEFLQRRPPVLHRDLAGERAPPARRERGAGGLRKRPDALRRSNPRVHAGRDLRIHAARAARRDGGPDLRPLRARSDPAARPHREAARGVARQGIEIQVPPGLPRPFDGLLPALLETDPAQRPRRGGGPRAARGPDTGTGAPPAPAGERGGGLVAAALVLGAWRLATPLRAAPAHAAHFGGAAASVERPGLAHADEAALQRGGGRSGGAAGAAPGRSRGSRRRRGMSGAGREDGGGPQAHRRAPAWRAGPGRGGGLRRRAPGRGHG